MTNDEKGYLAYSVKFEISLGRTEAEAVNKLSKAGYCKSTIRNYYKAFSKEGK